MDQAKTRSHWQIQRDVIYALVLRELNSQFGKTRGGFLWVLVEPLAHLMIPILVFGFIRQQLMPGVEYPVFLVYGFLPFLLFKGICLQTMDGTRAGPGLLSYRQVLLMDVFVAKTMALCVIQAVVFAIVLIALAMLGFEVRPARPVEFGAVIALTVALSFGLGLLFAAISSITPDARAIIRVMFMPLYFVSGILFPVTRFPDDWVRILSINPLLHLVESSRQMGMSSYEPTQFLVIEYPIALALASIVIGLMLYRLRFLARVTT